MHGITNKHQINSKHQNLSENNCFVQKTDWVVFRIFTYFIVATATSATTTTTVPATFTYNTTVATAICCF